MRASIYVKHKILRHSTNGERTLCLFMECGASLDRTQVLSLGKNLSVMYDCTGKLTGSCRHYFTSPLSRNPYLHSYMHRQRPFPSFGDTAHPPIRRKIKINHCRLEVYCVIQLFEAVEGLRNDVPSSAGVHRGRIQGTIGSALKGLIATARQTYWGRSRYC